MFLNECREVVLFRKMTRKQESAQNRRRGLLEKLKQRVWRALRMELDPFEGPGMGPAERLSGAHGGESTQFMRRTGDSAPLQGTLQVAAGVCVILRVLCIIYILALSLSCWCLHELFFS